MAGWTGSRSSADSHARAVDNDDGIYTQLLQQASDLNSELCRENSELRREVAELRQRQVQRMKRDADSSRTAKVRRLMPRAMSNIKSALRDLPEPAEGLPHMLEEAANRVFASMAELQESNSAMASGEETAALIAEKVALKEFCIHQQERLLELELAKEKLHANSGNWALRLTSALQGISEVAPRHSPKNGAQQEVVVQLPIVNVGDECEVVGRRGAILREREDLESPLVATVGQGGHVRIVQVASSESRRALVEVIDSPEVDPPPAGGCAVPGSIGWLSVSTKDGKALIRPVSAMSEVAQVVPSAPAAPSQPRLDAPEAEEAATEKSAEQAEQSQQTEKEQTEHTEQTEQTEQNEQTEQTEQIEQKLEEGEASKVEPSEEVTEVPEEKASEAESAPVAGVPSTETEVPKEPPESKDAEPEAPALEGKGSLRASNEAWVELRRERRQRERQVKAMQAQVESARKQGEQLDEVKTKLREYRSAALEARVRGQEFLEGLRMASEELRVIDRPQVTREVVEPEEPEEPGPVEAVLKEPEEQMPEDAFVDEEAVEWRRLLSERETTARELASTLRQVEEMEKEVEDRRIELDIAQRRRERERSSLLMALRELGYWQGSPTGKPDDEAALDEGETSDGPSSRTAWASESSPSGHPSGQKGRDEDKERQYLQRISELEESALKLQEQIDAVQARVALLNQQAVTRQQALRYASSLPAVGGLAEAITARVTSRPDVDGLTEMLGRLFVENFDLRRKLRAVGSENDASQSESSAAQALVPLDLSRFAVPEGADSDDESLVPSLPSIPSLPYHPLGAVTEMKPSASLRLPSPEAVLKPSDRPKSSPRSLLLTLDFKDLPVAE